MSKALQEYLLDKVRKSSHKELLLENPPKVIGGGDEILVAIGPDDTKVVYVGIRHGGDTIRVGFAARDRWANEEVEEAVESNGGTMTEFLEDEMEADDELEYQVQHFHDTGWFHFASDIPKGADWFASDKGREVLWYYVDGYARGILPHVIDNDEE
ncbi:MAG: hypothetical protein JJU11_00725 [Candidatus Sumerlaeia bacterium]|nr:hypothetical protein [Candidatus Sumerlaeia bacterium]